MSPSKLNREDGLKVFFINYSDLDGRFDPLYYFSVNNLSIVNKTRYPVKKLSEVIEMQRGRFGHRPRNEPRFYGGEYPFIQTGDIVRASQSNGQITYSQTLNELGLKASRLFSKPIVVVTIAANIGDTAILDYPACFPDSLIGMTPKSNELTLEYINLYFKFIKTYLEDLAPQSAQKNINYQQLSPVPIVIPPSEIQHRAVQIYQTALILRQQKEQQAQALLAGIDVYLLVELGISLYLHNNSQENRMFTVPFCEVSGNRLDANYHQDKSVKAALDGSYYDLFKIKEKCTFLSGYAFSSNDYIESLGCYLVTIKNISKNLIDLSNCTYLPAFFYEKYNRFKIEKNDLVFAMTGATIGKVGIFEQDTKALLNQRNGILRSDKMNTYYLMNLLNTALYQNIILKNSVGGAQPNISETAILNLLIPLPPIEKQNEIAGYIANIRNQAKQLQTEAAQILTDAKAKVELLILGEA